jgi:poly(A) polymerase
MAALLHDVGKPATARETPDRIRFDGHATHGAEMARRIMQRLKFPSDDIKAVVKAIRDHMRFMDVPRMRPATLRRLVAEATYPLQIELHRLDCLASHGDLANYDRLRAFEARLASAPALPAPWVTGDDVMALGVPEGPAVGRWKKKIFDAQISDRFASREEAIAWLAAQVRRAARAVGSDKRVGSPAPSPPD